MNNDNKKIITANNFIPPAWGLAHKEFTNNRKDRGRPRGKHAMSNSISPARGLAHKEIAKQ